MLENVRVLDLSRLLPGPFASMVLADLGARVDKLEDRKAGDYLRVMPPSADDGMNAVFHDLNRGKRSAVLDLKNEAGRAAFLRLVASYDVLLESFRPGVMERLGLGWETLHEANPKLIYCAITGYGQDGPAAQRAGHDLNYLARAGVLGFTGPAGGPPQVPGVQVADIGGGALYAVIGILGALHERAQTGKGRFVDVSMCEGALTFAMFGYGAHAGGMNPGRGHDVLMGGIAPYGTYATKDGKYMALAALEPKFWTAFCAGVGIKADLQALAPGAHQEKHKAALVEVFASKTRDEWIAFADEHDCCLEPVWTPQEAQQDPQHVARGVFQKGAGFLQTRTPVAEAREGDAPKKGAHTAEVFADAGFSPDEIEALKQAGATSY